MTNHQKVCYLPRTSMVIKEVELSEIRGFEERAVRKFANLEECLDWLKDEGYQMELNGLYYKS